MGNLDTDDTESLDIPSVEYYSVYGGVDKWICVVADFVYGGAVDKWILLERREREPDRALECSSGVLCPSSKLLVVVYSTACVERLDVSSASTLLLAPFVE